MSNFLATLGGALGGLFGVDDSDVKARQSALEDSLRSGALHNAADYGAAGAALRGQASALQGQNVGLDWSKVDADDARLAAVRQHYADQFRNGGPAGAAAVEAAQSARGLNARGGIAGIRADTLASQDAQGQVASTAQNEIAQAGDAANQLDTQKAAVALRKAVLAAQVSHANFENHLKANQTAFDLANSQAQLFNQAQSSFNDLQNDATGTGIAQEQQQTQIGAQAAQGVLGAATGLTSQLPSLGSALSSAQASSAPTLSPLTAAQIQASPTGTGAGYISPTATMGRTAVVNPIFATPPTLPSDASFFNRGT